MAVAAAGIARLRVDTNHINFFADDHPLHQSATVIDEQLSGIYSFNILLEGEPDSMKTPDALRRMEELRVRLERLPFVRKVVSVADYVKRVNRELNGGDADAGRRAGERRKPSRRSCSSSACRTTAGASWSASSPATTRGRRSR